MPDETISSKFVQSHFMNVILTGVTGTLGSQILFELLGRTDVDRIYLLVRRKGNKTAVSRLQQVLKSKAAPDFVTVDTASAMERLTVIESDDFLNPSQWLSKSENNYFIHSAGFVNLTTDPAKKDEVFRENFGFTERVFNSFAEFIDKFTYISTAFSIGDVGGVIDNDYHSRSPKFRNFYEESKYKTEQFLLGEQESSGVEIQILRPSVLGGNINNVPQYFISNYMVYYLLGKFFFNNPFLKNASIRFAIDMETGLNIVPVDYVAKTIATVFTRDIKQLNIAQSRSTNVARGMSKIIETIGGFDNFSFVNAKKADADLEDKTSLERMYHKTIGLHLNRYLTSQPYEYNTSLLESIVPMPEYDLEDYLVRTISFAKQDEFKGENW